MTIEDDFGGGPSAVSVSALPSREDGSAPLPGGAPAAPRADEGDHDGSIFGLRPLARANDDQYGDAVEADGLAFAEEEDEFLVVEEESAAESPGHALFADGAEPRWLGVRFSKNGQVYYVPDKDHAVRKGTKVVVKQESGPVLAEVVCVLEGKSLLPGKDISSPGKRILGVATAQDIARHTENSILADEAKAFCKTCIRQRELDMKLVDVEVLHDRSKIIFYFTAPSRIDFRELVKDLVRNYRTRIELRQIGVRHESQMIGGLGNCGMVCCCHQYLRKFAPVTIKMAKEQNLFLNPAKLSGMCGRLLCCLSFEQGNYEEFNRRCPKIGKRYVTEARGTVRILRANMFSQTISAASENGEECEFSLEEWENMQPRRAEPHSQEPRGHTHTPHEHEEEGGRQGRHKRHAQRGEHKHDSPDDASFPSADSSPESHRHAKKGAGKPRQGKRNR